LPTFVQNTVLGLNKSTTLEVSLLADILHNIFFLDQQKIEIHTDLKQH